MFAQATLSRGGRRRDRRDPAGTAGLRPAAGRPDRTAPRRNCAACGRPSRTTRRCARPLMLVAARAGLSDLTAQLADLVQEADGEPRDDLRFPVPTLRPLGGFRVDPALVYCVTRRGIQFRPHRRLLRRRARTDADHAGHRAHTADREEPTMPWAAACACTIPRFNLELGQRYVAYLAEQDGDRRRPDPSARQLQFRARQLLHAGTRRCTP